MGIKDIYIMNKNINRILVWSQDRKILHSDDILDGKLVDTKETDPIMTLPVVSLDINDTVLSVMVKQ